MRHPAGAFLAVSAFMLLSRCAVGPDYAPPAVAVPGAFGAATQVPAVAGASATADFVRWWHVLRDPQLDLLIERAIAYNPDIDIALTRVQEARSQEIVVVGGMLPTIGGSAAAAAGTGTNLMRGRIAPPIFAGADARGVRQIDRMAGFDANWEIDLFGKDRRALAAAQDDAEAQTEQRNAVLITVIADVARVYLNIRALQIRLENARRIVVAAQRTVDFAVEKLQRGPPDEKDRTPRKPDGKSPDKETGSSKDRTTSSKDEGKDANADASKEENNKSSKKDGKSENKALSNEMSLAMAKAELETQVARLPQLAAAISAAESRLALLLGTYAADIEATIRGPAKLPPLPDHLRPGMPVDLLRRRPDIRAAERKLAAATERIGVATANLFPSVALTAGFGAQGTQGTQGNTPPFRGPIWSAGPRAYWPLLDFGRLDALINIEEMRTHEDLIRYRQTIMEAVEEVDQAIRQYHLDLQRSKALAAAQEDLRRAVGLMLERYRRGEEELPAVVGLQRWHHAHSEQAATAAEGAVLRYVAFYKALGGGWELYADLPPVPPVQPAVAASIRRLTSGWH